MGDAAILGPLGTLWLLRWAILVGAAGWLLAVLVARRAAPGAAALVLPVLFGATVLAMWEIAVPALAVPAVILPAPSAIAAAFAGNLGTLWADTQQTILKGALTGYAVGCAAAVALALLVDRSPGLARGLLPVGTFMAALPIVGTAPILVMWFGFGWQSKAAVVVLMVFFPMLVNTVAGLGAASAMQRDLMRTWGASWGRSLWSLRLPAAMPFVFNGLKVCTTLALIGAIVAEFFGSPTVGLGFRISTSVGSLALDVVWAAILVSALAGTLFYGIVAAIERGVTFWHPSQRT